MQDLVNTSFIYQDRDDVNVLPVNTSYYVFDLSIVVFIELSHL